MLVEEFEHCAAKAAFLDAVLHGDDSLEPLSHLMKDVLVYRLEETHVVMCHGQGGGLLGHLYRLLGFLSDGADGDDCHVLPVFQLPSFPNLDFLKRALPFHNRTPSSGVSDDEGAFAGKLGRIHESSQFGLVVG